jgi:alkaline phosphatase
MRGNRTRNHFSHLALIILTILITLAAASDIQAKAGAGGNPKNIIILFADGVAGSQLEVARYASHNLRKTEFSITDTILKEGNILLLINNRGARRHGR